MNLFLRKISLAVYIRRNHHYFNLKLKYTVLYIYLLNDVAGFLKITISMHENITAGRLKLCGMENRTVVAHGCRKTKKLICGMEGENIMAYGRLPSFAHKCNSSTIPIFGLYVR